MSELNIVGAVLPKIETTLIVDEQNTITPIIGQTNDPAIWINSSNSQESIIIGTLNDGGLAVFDLDGSILQTILPNEVGDISYHSVDIVYDFELNNQSVDLAIFSDRENDTLGIYAINPLTRNLEDITADDVLESIFGIDDGIATAYGLATYTSPIENRSYIFVTQAEGNQIAQLELIGNDDGTVNTELVTTIELPVAGGDDVADYQAEAIVVDREKAIVYVAVEDRLGIVKFSAEPDSFNEIEVVYSLPSTNEPSDLNLDDIIVFGDSIADVGNANIATANTVFPSPPYNNGRSSNGLSIVELIAEQIGLANSASIPSLAGGDNYAFGGAELGDGISALNSPNIGLQIDSYLATNTPTATDLFLIVGVANNILTNATVTPQSLVDLMVEHIETLVSAGATSFAIVDSPPVDDTPAAVGLGIGDLAQTVKTAYNQLLDTTLDELRDDLGITIYELKTSPVYDEIEANPSDFGFTNIVAPVLDTNTLTLQGNPDEFFWWDSTHPTLSANQIFADSVVEQILVSNDDGSNPNDTLPLVADLQGLSIYYGADGEGYLIASGEGDSGYAVFRREGNNEYLGNFVINENGDLGIDGVSQTSALDITNVALGSSFPNGLLLVTDEANIDNADDTTNFKLIGWDEVASTFEPDLIIDTTSFDPRNPTPQPFFNLDTWFELNINTLAPIFESNSDENDLGQLIYNFDFISDDREIEMDLTEDVTDLGTDAVFQNLVGLYEINDENGGIDIDGDGVTDLLPSDEGYARNALTTNRVDNFLIRAGGNGASEDNTITEQFKDDDVIVFGGKRYSTFVIANGGVLGDIDDFVAQEDSETDGIFNDMAQFIDDRVAYFSFIGANPDGVEHLQARGNNIFGFEDLPSNLGVSDNDFNDAVFQLEFLV